jgi:uncharacterized membrane protein YhiD involved in acid resistance
MLEGFQSNLINAVEFNTFIVNLLVALVCGFIISIFYRVSYRGPHYSTSFVQAMIILSMVTALVIMVIGNNLARAFGLVGAMSIIRFRTAVKDTQDIVFIFFSLAAGMAAGVGLNMIAIAGSSFIGLILLGLSKFEYAKPQKRDFLLQFQCKMNDGNSHYISVLDKYCKRHKLINMQSLGMEDLYELSFYVQLRDKEQRTELVRNLNQLAEITQVRLFVEEEM